MVGAISGKYLFSLLGVPTHGAGWAVRGFSYGTAAHGIGAARALQVNADAGAYAGLALGLQVILASVLIPLAYQLIQG
jgi:putative effector of murein hydrolase